MRLSLSLEDSVEVDLEATYRKVREAAHFD